MIIQQPQRIKPEDYTEDSREDIARLAGILNSFMEEVYTALNKNLDITDNLNSSILTFRVAVNGGNTPTTKISLKPTLKTNIRGVLVMSASGANVLASPFITWSQNNGVLIINQIFGLTPGIDYTLTILVIGS